MVDHTFYKAQLSIVTKMIYIEGIYYEKNMNTLLIEYPSRLLYIILLYSYIVTILQFN